MKLRQKGFTRTNSDRSLGGFTLLELIVATTVVGVVIFSISSLVISLNAVNDRVKDLTLVNALAENKIETLRSVGFAGLSNGTYDFSNELPDEIESPLSATYEISTYSSNIKLAKLAISYSDAGNTKTQYYQTFIGELGIGQY